MVLFLILFFYTCDAISISCCVGLSFFHGRARAYQEVGTSSHSMQRIVFTTADAPPQAGIFVDGLFVLDDYRVVEFDDAIRVEDREWTACTTPQTFRHGTPVAVRHENGAVTEGIARACVTRAHVIVQAEHGAWIKAPIHQVTYRMSAPDTSVDEFHAHVQRHGGYRRLETEGGTYLVPVGFLPIRHDDGDGARAAACTGDEERCNEQEEGKDPNSVPLDTRLRDTLPKHIRVLMSAFLYHLWHTPGRRDGCTHYLRSTGPVSGYRYVSYYKQTAHFRADVGWQEWGRNVRFTGPSRQVAKDAAQDVVDFLVSNAQVTFCVAEEEDASIQARKRARLPECSGRSGGGKRGRAEEDANDDNGAERPDTLVLDPVRDAREELETMTARSVPGYVWSAFRPHMTALAERATSPFSKLLDTPLHSLACRDLDPLMRCVTLASDECDTAEKMRAWFMRVRDADFFRDWMTAHRHRLRCQVRELGMADKKIGT